MRQIETRELQDRIYEENGEYRFSCLKIPCYKCIFDKEDKGCDLHNGTINFKAIKETKFLSDVITIRRLNNYIKGGIKEYYQE